MPWSILLTMASFNVNEYFGNWSILSVILLVVGIALVITEMALPGFGLPGICGGISLVLAVVLQAKTFTDAMISILIIMSVLGVAAFIVFRSFKKGRISKSPIVLNYETYSKVADENAMMGKRGKALNDLRPSGFAEIDGARVDVVTQGDFIKKGDDVEIIATEGHKLIVRQILSTDKQA